MSKFIVILADRNEPALHERFVSYAVALRRIFPKVLLIQPHILLFQSEKDLTQTARSLPSFAHQDGQELLFQIHGEYRGSALATRTVELNQFFRS